MLTQSACNDIRLSAYDIPLCGMIYAYAYDISAPRMLNKCFTKSIRDRTKRNFAFSGNEFRNYRRQPAAAWGIGAAISPILIRR